jgi:CoA:oxalate CoA-transferase
VKDRFIGEFDIPGLPVKFSEWCTNTSLSAALLGEHNEQVLRELLSISDTALTALYSDHVLVRDELLDAVSPESLQESEANGPRIGANGAPE